MFYTKIVAGSAPPNFFVTIVCSATRFTSKDAHTGIIISNLKYRILLRNKNNYESKKNIILGLYKRSLV